MRELKSSENLDGGGDVSHVMAVVDLADFDEIREGLKLAQWRASDEP